MWDNPGEGELDPGEGFRRHCKNSLSILFCIGKRTREGCDHGSEVETVNSGSWEGPVPPRNRRNLAEEGVVRKISSPKSLASVHNLYNGQGR